MRAGFFIAQKSKLVQKGGSVIKDDQGRKFFEIPLE
jgi:hypothetical protein